MSGSVRKNTSNKAMNSSKKKCLTPKMVELNEILAINDRNEKNKSFNELINHLLLHKCVDNKCHDLSQLLLDLTTNLINLMNFEKTIDKLIAEFKWNQMNDNQIEDRFCELICETINLKPYKCVQILDDIIIPKLSGFSQFNGEKEVNSQEILLFDKIHKLLSNIKIANFETILLRSVERKFPFAQNCSTHSHTCYVFNLLKIYDYIVDKERLIAFVFDKLLWIDLMLTPEKVNVEPEVFSIDDCDYVKSASNVAKLVELLDHSMEVLFKFIDNKTLDITSDQSSELFQLFETIFVKIILTIENCYHLQYVMFYFCSICKLFCDQFIQTLWKIGLNNEISLNIREKALYYVSSLLRNAKFVTINTMLSFMDMTSRWIHSYIDTKESLENELTSSDAIFYVLCEILFEIFCSNHTDFDNSSLRRVKVMNFQRIIKCKLNPLSYCSRDIGVKFLPLARHYQIGYCSQTIQRDDERLNKLPFDHLSHFNAFGSYFLPKSYSKIQFISKHSMNDENMIYDIERFNPLSDESDHIIGSHQFSYSPSKKLLYNLMSDSSPNDQMDFN